MKEVFTHRAESLSVDRPLVYTAMSKHLFYFRMQISTFVLEKGCVPLNPFMVFDYFLNDGIDRDVVREANNNLVKRSDEIWVFGPVSDGALAEIRLAKVAGKKVCYFAVVKSRKIEELTKVEVELEPEVAAFRDQL